MPAVFKINPALHYRYHGAGIAIGAATGGELVDFRYLRDVFPELDENDEDQVCACLVDEARLGPTIREMQALGEVFVGMCQCYEFVEI